MTINSGGTFTLAGGQLVVGNQAGSTGTLTINAGGSFVVTEAAQTANYLLDIGRSAAAGSEPAAMGMVTVQGQGALLNMGNNPIRVGYAGSGTLSVLDGGVVDAGSIDSSSAAGTASLSVGRSGSGIVNVSGAGSTLSLTGDMYDGRAAGSVGVINVTDGGRLQVSLDPTGAGILSIGTGNTTQGVSGGSGTLNVNTSGTVVTADELLIGLNGTTGTVELDTGGSVTASQIIQVGGGTGYTGGSGTVLIEGAAGLHSTGPHVTQTAAVAIANAASTTGKVTVTGAGSVLDGGGDRITVGNRGQGTLIIENGASASSGSTLYSDAAVEAGFSAGSGATGTGTVTVDGAGSSLTVNGAITLGGSVSVNGGTGSLTASDGGTVTGTGLTLWSGGILDADGASLIEIGAGAAATGGVTIQAGSQLTAHGGAITAAIANAGTLSNDGTLNVTGAITGAGMIALGANSTTNISGSIAGQTVDFTGANGRLALQTFTGSTTVTDAQIGDVVDLVGQTDVTATPTTVTSGSGALVFTNLAPDTQVMLISDGNGGMEATIACYCPGTAILTNRGEVPVEALAIGDPVVTLSGALQPIRWIGRRSYAGAFVAGNHLMLPVCIKAGALAGGVPRRDLHVSPGHAMFVDGQLVPAWRLINGVSIVQAEAVDHVSYYHVELGCHDVILANGAPAESFLDDGCRHQFHNAAEFQQLYPDATPMVPLQPRLEDGFALQAVQARLATRAGVTAPVEPIGTLRGFVDIATPERVAGWAQDADSPEEPVALEISINGFPALCALANGFRADLRRVGLGSGCHAFDMALPAGFSGSVEVRRVTDRAKLASTDAVESRRAA